MSDSSYVNDSERLSGNTADPSEAADSEPAIESRQKDAPLLPMIITGTVLFAAIFSATLFIEFPLYTYGAKEQEFSGLALAKSNMSGKMSKIERKEAEENYGINFSALLVPQEMESTDVMKTIARDCLPQGTYKQQVLADQAHETFTLASDYLACAIKTAPQRLCQNYQRQRLVEQLMGYLSIRQNMIALEEARLEILAERYGKKSSSRSDAAGKTPEDWRNAYPRIDTKVDHRITGGLAELSQQGYITPSDFGWFGAILPREYAPFLATGAVEENRCG